MKFPGRALFIILSAFFVIPAAAQEAALPEPTALLHKVKDNQKHLQELRRNYICHESDESDELDKNGAVKKHETAEYEMYWRGRYQIRRQLSKNGKAAGEEEKKKQDEKIEKEVAKLDRKLEKEEAKGDGDTIGIETFLRASTFTNLHREEFRGHRVIAMDLEPNPSYSPSTLAEKIVHLLRGRVWIDEEAAQIVRLEAHLDKKLKVAGGLAASIAEGSGAVLEQQRINDEVWMPSLADVNVNGRAFLFAGIHQHIVQRFSDYRKFRTETRILPVETTPETAPAPIPPPEKK